tara:strand:+ start:384 stop:1247 length:864 start_codon:yes stop_codon:yes gene_type:complete
VNILITGANSSLANVFLNYLQKYDKKKNFVYYGTTRNEKKLIEYKKIFNVDFNSGSFEKIPVCFDLVIHIAALVPSSKSKNEDYFSVNYKNPIKFFHSLKYKKNSKFLNISSISIYRKTKAKYLSEESMKVMRDDDYGLSKLYFENALEKLFLKNDLSIISIRVPCLIVPNVKGNFISKWKKNIIMGKEITLTNPESMFNALVDGDSIIRFILKIKKNKILTSLNVASKSNLSIKEVAMFMAKNLKMKLKYKILESSGPSQIIITDKAERLGFIPPDIRDVINQFTN